MGKVCAIFIAVVAAATLVASNDRSDKGDIIESPRVTNWGDWGEWSECQEGMFVNGMRLKTEAKAGHADQSALNAIRLICSPPGSKKHREIKSLEERWGGFGKTFYCPEGSFAEGFVLRSEKNQGWGDDSAGNNLRLLCNDARRTVVEGDGLDYGDWTDPQKCPESQIVCGLRTQIEAEHTGDQSALNNVDMVCCDEPESGASNPEIVYVYDPPTDVFQ